jgi:hypothetical protein
MCGSIPPFPNTPSWGGAQFKKAHEQLYLVCLKGMNCDKKASTVTMSWMVGASFLTGMEIISITSSLLYSQ